MHKHIISYKSNASLPHIVYVLPNIIILQWDFCVRSWGLRSTRVGWLDWWMDGWLEFSSSPTHSSTVRRVERMSGSACMAQRSLEAPGRQKWIEGISRPHSARGTDKSGSCLSENWQLFINLWTLKMLKLWILKKSTGPLESYIFSTFIHCKLNFLQS